MTGPSVSTAREGEIKMVLKKVTHSGCTPSQNAKLTDSMKSGQKDKWVVAVELDDGESLTFEAYSGKQLKVVSGSPWPSQLSVTPASGTLANSVTISASGVPSSKKGRKYWYRIEDASGNLIDPIIIPR